MSDAEMRPVRVAVVGAARGIGSEVAMSLAKSGAMVAAIDFALDNSELGYSLGRIDTADFGEFSKDILRIGADAREPQEMAAAAQRIRAEMGGLDQLVVTAGGIVGGQNLSDSDAEAIRLAMDFNLFTIHNSVRAMVPLIKESASISCRRVVGVTSVAGSKALGGIGPYVAAKHAAVGYLKTLAVELAPEAITVNWVSPGSTDTEILKQSAELYGLGSVEDFTVHHRLARLISANEVAAAIVFLLSESAGAITGLDLFVDAGMRL